jgi:hypothetical protein
MSDHYQPQLGWLFPQRFDYAPVNEMWAAVWLETPLAVGVKPPGSPMLAVRSGAAETSHPAFLSCTQRLRSNGGRPTPGAVADVVAGSLLWRARFPVPLDVVEDPHAQFMLTADDGVVIGLPVPKSLAVIAGADFASAVDRTVRVRRHAAAFAAGVAVASMPATAAVADTAPSGTAAATTTGQAAPTTTPDTSAATTSTTTTTTTSTTTPPATTTPPPATTTPTTPTAPPPTPTTQTPTPTTAAPATSTAAPAPVPPAATHAPTKPKGGTGGASVPSGTTTPAPMSHTRTRKHHRTSLRCTFTPASKPKLSKKALVTVERVELKAKCVTTTKKKSHKHHKPVGRSQTDATHLGGGAAKVLATGTPGADVLQANPAVASVWSRLSTLLARGDRPPSFLIPIYKAAGRRYHVPWAILAAINAVETDYGRNLNISSAGAMGWMQFMPETWLEYGVLIGNHGTPNPYDPRDAIFSAARYLAANGGRHHLRRAIFAYNHAKWYVDEVLWTAASILDHTPARGSRARVKLDAMRAMALALDGLPYIWSGGHGGWEMANGYDCSGFVSTVLHAAGYLSEPVTTQSLPDSRHILQGPGRYVTIFDRTDGGALTQDHVIIDLNGQWWESGGIEGAGVHRIKHISASYLLTFNQILHPRGL